MLGHEIQHGKVGNTGEFAGVVALELRANLESGVSGGFPVLLRPGPRTDCRNGVFSHRALDTASFDRQVPFADRHQARRRRQTGNHVRSITMSAPSPVRHEHLGLRIAAVNALFNDGVDLRNNVRVAAVLAALAGLPVTVGMRNW